MKKLFTFLLVSFLVTTKMLATTYTIAEASGTTGAQIATDISTAVGLGNTDITIQLENGGTYGTLGTDAIAVPAGVTKLTIYAAPGTMPTFNCGAFITFADAGVMTRITIDGVKAITTVGTSKALIACTSSTYPLGVTIQNSYVTGFRYVIRASTTPTAELLNGITVNNNIFKSMDVFLTGFTNIINTQTYTNNTFLDTNGGVLIDYRTALNAGMNFTFSNNTIYSLSTPNIGTGGLIRLAGNPATGTYTISRNIIASGSVQTYAVGNYQAYANLNFATSYTTNNITYTAKGFTNIQSYTSGIATLAPGYATYDLTIGDATFPGKSSCGDPRWYYIAVTPSVASLSGFSYNEGSGPSASQSFTVSAVALRTAITLTAPADYEISTDNSAFLGSLSIGTAGSDLSATTVYVRLKAGLSFAAYNNETIAISTTGMSDMTVACSGNVSSVATSINNQTNSKNLTVRGSEIFLNGAANVTVVNATGVVVKSLSNVNRVSLNNLPNGIYIVKSGNEVLKVSK